jgi:anion-transporting  ArsA/GET3 family ATPase
MLASSGTFQYFAAAAPGAKELFGMVKVWELTQSKRWQRRARSYDLVVLDAPATGHALGMLASPQTFGAIARVGPVASQAERVSELLRDRARSGYMAVAQGAEMAVTETLELRDGLREKIGRDLDTVVVNGLLPRRFSAPEMRRISSIDGVPDEAPPTPPGDTDADSREAVLGAAAHAAYAVHERARLQHNQVMRLRRRELDVLGIPFLWRGTVDLESLETIVEHLGRRL